MDGPTVTPPARSPGRLIPLLSAWTCWLIGGHALIAPGVIGYVLARLCIEEGAPNVLGSAPGLRLAAMVGCSAISSLAILRSGYSYYRARWQAGNWQLATSVGLALATIALIAMG